MTASDGITAEQARQQMAADRKADRDREAACRLAFLVYGDAYPGEDGEPVPHATVCVCAPACSRNYDPLPYPEAEPKDKRLYEGTAIGALYGIAGGEHLLGALAGWNLIPRSERYE